MLQTSFITNTAYNDQLLQPAYVVRREAICSVCLSVHGKGEGRVLQSRTAPPPGWDSTPLQPGRGRLCDAGGAFMQEDFLLLLIITGRNYRYFIRNDKEALPTPHGSSSASPSSYYMICYQGVAVNNALLNAKYQQVKTGQ